MNLLTRSISLKTAAIALFVGVALVGFFLYRYNPYEKGRQERDKKRIENLKKLSQAIRDYLQNNKNHPAPLCDNCQVGETIFTTGALNIKSAFQEKVSDSTAVNITGWVTVDFSLNAKIGQTPIKILPLDPINKDPYVYTFTPGKNGTFKLTASLESSKNSSIEQGDGGTDSARYELGTDLTLLP